MISPSLKHLLGCLPTSVSTRIFRLADSYYDFERSLEEIRLRAGRPSSIVMSGENISLSVFLSADELSECLISLCGGSVYPWEDSLREGYIGFSGGYRVGVAGRASPCGGRMDYRATDALCIRIPHSVVGAGQAVVEAFRSLPVGQGVLIYSPPGGGKTTALRDAAATLSAPPYPLRTVVIDSRGEIDGEWFEGNHHIDVLKGYSKAEGIELATRTLSPQLIVCDEIGGSEEASAFVEVVRCGIPVIASAHGSSREELYRRPSLARLLDSRAFGGFVGIKRREGNIYDYRTELVSEKDSKE